MQLPQKPEYKNHCEALKGVKTHVKIISIKKSGDFKYDRIEAVYEKKREIAVFANYFSEGALRKVYRYFPKHYRQIDGEWMSMVSRVRTVAGNEKKFSFETLLIIQRRGKKTYQLYLDPKKDPSLKKADFSLIYNTN